VATLRLFGPARDAAGTGTDTVTGATVGDALGEASARYGSRFAEVLLVSRVWLNGEPVEVDAALGEGDELAVLPPVSGG
jgi:molybdopterin synthase sulfur carrier subunit